MHTAVTFSGIDGLDLFEHRRNVLAVGEVIERLYQAQKILEAKKITQELHLVDFLRMPDAEFHQHLPLKAFACSVVHVGLYEHYIKHNPEPDYIFGLSLGDVARTVVAGALSFEDMVLGTYLFNREGIKIQGGSIVRVRAEAERISDEAMQSAEQLGLTIAVHQTPRHCLVSGPDAELKAWGKELAPLYGLQVKPLYNKPLHSTGMAPALLSVKRELGITRVENWSRPIISSVYGKQVQTKQQLMQDIEQNMVGPVFWWQTVQRIVRELGVRKIINIGPIHTCIEFIQRIPLDYTLEVADCLSLDQSRMIEGRLQVTARCI